MSKKLDYNYCKAAPILEWMSHKWALIVLLRIEEKQQNDTADIGIRYGELFRSIPHISEKVLAATLDYLEKEGLVIREEHDGFPPLVQYSLTSLAKAFLLEISYVIEWGQLHFEEITSKRSYGKS